MLRPVMARHDSVPEDVQLTAYRCLLDSARAMLQAAREQRWDDLAMLGNEREARLAQVMEADIVSTRPADIAEKTELIQNTLDCDEQTRVLVRAWQGELVEMLGSVDNERKLADAYHSG